MTMDTENEEIVGIPIPNQLSFPPELSLHIRHTHILGSAERNKAAQEEALRKYLGRAHKGDYPNQKFLWQTNGQFLKSLLDSAKLYRISLIPIRMSFFFLPILRNPV